MDSRRITLENRGKEYSFLLMENEFGKKSAIIGGGKHLGVSDSEIINIEISKECVEVMKPSLIIKRTKIVEEPIIIITSEHFFEKKQTKIYFNKKELTKAEQIVSHIQAIIVQNQERKKEFEEQIKKAKATDTIEIINENGEKENIWRRETFFKDYVLISDGGETYHTHADCFEQWKPQYKRKFKGWKKILLSEAENMGLSECKFCEKYYDLDDED